MISSQKEMNTKEANDHLAMPASRLIFSTRTLLYLSISSTVGGSAAFEQKIFASNFQDADGSVRPHSCGPFSRSNQCKKTPHK